MRTAPCLNCCQRHPGCHSICDLYQEYRDMKQRIQDEVISAEFNYNCYLSDAIERMKGVRGYE